MDRELVLTLDDLLVEDGKIAPFSPAETTYAAMGRFGNVFLVSGEPDLQLAARAGEVVRLWLTNTANTRVFNVAVPGARMKLVGGDSGRVEHEEFVEGVLLAPSERAVADVLVEPPGELTLEHRTPGRNYRLARIRVSQEQAMPSLRAGFEVLRTAPELAAERRAAGPLAGRATRQDLGPGRPDGRPGRYASGGGARHLCLPYASRGDQ